MRNSEQQRGFSLIEVLLVCVIIGMIAAVAVPSLMSSKEAAEKASTVATLRTMHTTEAVYNASRGRFARLNELNGFHDNNFGTMQGSQLRRQNWIYLMLPTPTDVSLRKGYTIYTFRLRTGRPISLIMMSQDGLIQQISP